MPPLPVDSEDELGQLTRAFNEMEKKLERVDRARSEFIANASHELRTPIHSLGGFVELLRDEELDAAARAEFLQAIAEQVERLQKLATDLLDLSRLDAGSLDLTAEHVDLAELARSVAREFVPALDRHGSKLALDIETGRVEAVCDPDRVAQIMRILLDNALRHTPPGTDVEISAGREDGQRADRRSGHRPRARGAHAAPRIRALLHRRRRQRLRPRARDREGARRADGRRHHADLAAGPHGLQPRPAGERGVRAPLAGALCALALAGAGCALGDDEEDEPASSDAPERVETTRVQVVEGIGKEGGFDPREIYDRLRRVS